MATGDSNDMLERMQALLPRGWFGDSPTILTALLKGFAAILANVYAVLAYAKLQTRILTATDGFLDVISADFFGSNLPRRTGESDAAFRNRIVVNLFRERATRKAVIQVLTTLTGRAPLIVEPMRPADTGGYGGTDAITINSAQIYRNDWQGNQLLSASPRTNLDPYSNPVGGTGWTLVSISAAVNSLLGPDGLQSGALLTPTTSGTLSARTAVATVAAGSVATRSVFIQKGTATLTGIRVYDGSIATEICRVVLNMTGTDPVVSTSTNVVGSVSIIAAPNGWYRVSFAFNTGAFTTVRALFYPDANNGTASTGYFGTQLEAASVVSPYISTSGAPVTLTDYVLSANGAIAFAVPPATAASLSWTGSYLSTQKAQTVNVTNLVFGAGDGISTAFSVAPKYGYVGGYGVAGAYGSLVHQYQAFVTAYRPSGTGIPFVAGYGSSPSGYSIASRGEYADLSQVQQSVTDADIFAAVASVIPAATIVWMRISS
jgi:hypothetical protein